MALIDQASYASIRAALDVSLTEAELPDGVIALDIYHGAGEDLVLALDPLAATRTGDQLARVRRAAIYFVAALLAPSLPTITAESNGDRSYARKAVDWDAVAARLLARATTELDIYLDVATVAPLPTIFTLAPGYRGR